MTNNKRNAFEIATWPCSEEYLKDQSIVHPALRMLDGQPGLDGIFYGIQVGKPNAYAVANWQTIDAHVNFAADKERLQRFVKMFGTSANGGVLQEKLIHVSWEASAALLCLGAPVTEIRKVKPREGVTLEAVQATLDKYVRYVNKLTTRAVGATYGQVIENPEEIALVIGWKTIEDKTEVDKWQGRKYGREEKEIREMTEEVEKTSVLFKQYRK
ncbi:hypothetical protein BJY52DRAFT_1221084 [Lactarius psammicola]|nr:hypothetical protein BJY52DRAFT_1221084 [Lactarius psammicola]